ncbi:metal-dependent hydrolase [Paenibacillus agaridevorans]|jgi:inner membrane protein|uniref:Metal-dependent hydrolase n=1 Tax=Paenibacillus agaridevorans TaxID=171404 RepID=A0A2R5F230_9BACL|nr:metal-dependent hydrolase [Paenibacillus agaridevorans]GBG09814.1 metal-dependent hydrolase [Paenibacillus agaridevorans]
MTGKTHLIIGAAIGALAVVVHSPDMEDSLLYIGVAAFSALAPDLDGPSMLSSKLTKLSKRIRELALWGGILYLAITAYLYFSGQPLSPIWAGGSIAAILAGLVMKQGAIRNALVSAVGLYLIYHGYIHGMIWLIGLGVFVVWAPWLKHRGMTHTVWMLPVWLWLGWGLEEQLKAPGLGITAMLGYLSHLVADTLTPSGVKWLSPLFKKSFKFRW